MRPDAGTAHRIRIVAARLTRQVYVGVLAAIWAAASKAADVGTQGLGQVDDGTLTAAGVADR